jgi:hypothetical protein
MHPGAFRTSAKIGIVCSQRWNGRASNKRRQSRYLMLDCCRRGMRDNNAAAERRRFNLVRSDEAEH